MTNPASLLAFACSAISSPDERAEFIALAVDDEDVTGLSQAQSLVQELVVPGAGPHGVGRADNGGALPRPA